MNTRVIGTLLSALLVIFAASYSIYTAARYFYSPYKTETVFQHTIADSYMTSIVAVRDEVLISGELSGQLVYICDDGDVLIPGMTIAETYESEEALVANAIADQYEREVELLEKAQSVSGKFLAADTLKTQINDAVGAIVDISSRQDLNTIAEKRDKLAMLMAQHLIITGRDSDFSDRIASLNSKKQEALSGFSQAVGTVKTPIGGYFCSVTDGYEDLLNSDFDSKSFEYFKDIIESGAENMQSAKSAVGRVQVGHNWYIAAILPKNQSDKLSLNGLVSVDFNLPECENIPATIYKTVQNENETLVILKTNRVNPQLITLRHANAEIKLRSYTGLRISPEAIRYDGQTEGVYVRQGDLISFKPIERVYTGENFIICSETSAIANSIKLFDEVIVEGTDLYDGKII